MSELEGARHDVGVLQADLLAKRREVAMQEAALAKWQEEFKANPAEDIQRARDRTAAELERQRQQAENMAALVKDAERAVRQAELAEQREAFDGHRRAAGEWDERLGAAVAECESCAAGFLDPGFRG
jgi:hypothetical protein